MPKDQLIGIIIILIVAVIYAIASSVMISKRENK